MVVGREVVRRLDLQHGFDDLGSDLLALTEAQKPVDRDMGGLGQRHQGLGPRQPRVLVGHQLRQCRAVDSGHPRESRRTETRSPHHGLQMSTKQHDGGVSG